MVSPAAYTKSRSIPNSRAAASAEAACWIWKSLSLVISETRNRSLFTWRRPQVAPGRGLCKRGLGYNLDSPLARVCPPAKRRASPRGLWSSSIQYNLLRSPLHSIMLVVIFFPVPPSTRQAAGPLTENLPHVCLSDRKTVDLSLERPSPRGTMRRLSTRVLPPAPAVHRIFVVCIDAYRALERRNELEASAKRSLLNAAANQWTTKRGHLA